MPLGQEKKEVKKNKARFATKCRYRMVYIEVKRTGFEFHDSAATTSICSVRVEPLCAVGAVAAYDEAAHVPTAVTVAVTVTVTGLAPLFSVPPAPVPASVAAGTAGVVAGTAMAVVGVAITTVLEFCEPEPEPPVPAPLVPVVSVGEAAMETVDDGRLTVT